MALTTLAGTKWRFNETIAPTTTLTASWVRFMFRSKDNRFYSGFWIGPTSSQFRYIWDFQTSTSDYDSYKNNVWHNENLREIEIFPTNYGNNPVDLEAPDVIAWFEANAVQLPILQEKEATPSAEEQEITPDEGFEGLAKVTVHAVASETLIPENIRKGVEIFGVTGTFDGFDPSNPIAQMTNLAGSGQDQFVHDWAQMAKIQLHEQGVSNAFLATDEAQFILAKAVTDLIEDGTLSATTLSLIATLRVNHPHTEDDEEEATQNV